MCKSQMTLGGVIVLLACVHVALCESVLVFERSLILKLQRAAAPALSTTYATYNFTATGGPCPPYSFNSGRWIDAFAFPGDSSSVNLDATGENSVRIGTSALVQGLSGSTTWTSAVNVSVTAVFDWWTCFQVCFGSSPYSSQTEFANSRTFSTGTGTRLTSASSFANIDSTTLVLTNVSFSCIASQEDFQSSFGSAMNQTLPLIMPAVIPVVDGAWNALLSNTSSTGFAEMMVNKTRLSLLLGLNLQSAGETIYEYLPLVLGNRSADVVALVPIVTSGTLPSEPTCIAFSGPPVDEQPYRFTLYNGTACLMSNGSSTFIIAAAGVDIEVNNSWPQAPTSTTTSGPRHTKGPRSGGAAKPLRQGAHPHRRVHRRVATAAAPQANATATKLFAGDLLLTKALLSAARQVSLDVHNITSPSATNTPLPSVEKYCTTSYEPFAWHNVPEELPFVVNYVSRSSEASNTATVGVSLPLLSGLRGTAAFVVNCTVILPFGPPLRDDRAGYFEVALSTNASDMSATLVVNLTAVTPVMLPTVGAMVTLSYEGDQPSLFDHYVRHLFESSIGAAVASQTSLVVQDTIMSLAAEHLAEVAATIPARSFVSSSDELGASLTVGSGPQTMLASVPLWAVVPSRSSPHDAGLLAVVSSTIPPFPINGSCSFDTGAAACSTVGTINAPLPSLVTMHACKPCIAAVAGSVVFGMRFNSSLSGVTDEQRDHRQRPVVHTHSAAPTAARRPSAKQPKGMTARPPEPRNGAQASLTNSALFLGTAILTQPVVGASADMLTAITDYTHAQQSLFELDYLPQCTITHEELYWVMLPESVKATVTKVDSAADSENATVTVNLGGLPLTLTSNTVRFVANCTIATGAVASFTESRTGTLNLSLSFASVAEVELSVSANSTTGNLLATPVNTTLFELLPTVAYDDPREFAFAPYYHHYAFNTLTSEVAVEFWNVLVRTAGEFAAFRLSNFLSATQSNCPLQAYNGSHLVIVAGPQCDQLPTTAPPSTVTRDEFLYLLDAGPAPTNMTGVHPATDTIDRCSAPFEIPFYEASVQLTNCSTRGIVLNGSVVVAIAGTLALP